MYDAGHPLQLDFDTDGYVAPCGGGIEFRLSATPRVCEIFVPARGTINFTISAPLSDSLEFDFSPQCWPPVGSAEEPEPEQEILAIAGTRSGWRRLLPVDRSLFTRWQLMARRDRQQRVGIAELSDHVDKKITVSWQDTDTVAKNVVARWRDTPVLDCEATRVGWYNPAPCETGCRARWKKLAGVERTVAVRWFGRCNYLDFMLQTAWKKAIPADNKVVIPWRNTLYYRDIVHRNYWGRELYERICTRDYLPPAGADIRFHFDTELVHVGNGTHLDFYFTALSYDLRCSQQEPSGWRDPYIPIKPASWPVTPKYLVLCVMNSASLIRVSDNEQIDVFSMGIKADLDSWCWSFTASIPATSLPLVDPSSDPVEVLATINGYSWRFMIESWSEQKSFGRAEYTITGRSPSAELAAPYAPLATGVNTSQLTSVQIAEEQLINTGWTIDFTAFDSWLVPAGALTYNNVPPLKVIQSVAEATGGRLQTHRENNQLIVRPRLHSLPWGWSAATPDLSISDYVVRQLGREFKPGVAYNAVFVGGETQGVLCKVYRSGTAGDKAAPMVTDALLTETAPCRARGKMIIGRSGKWSRETLELPLTAPGDLPGLLETGMLVSMAEGSEIWRGQVVGINVSAAWQRGKGLVVTQNIDVERYRGN